MLQAIGASANTGYAHGNSGSAGLRGQLAKLEKELSACINCATADTIDGKAKIADISARIAQIQDRITQASETKSTRQEASTKPAEAGIAGNDSTTGIGSLIDISV